MVTIDVFLIHDAKVNKPMWAWQLCDVVSPVEYASGKRPLRAYIAVCLQIHYNPCSLSVCMTKIGIIHSSTYL